MQGLLCSWKSLFRQSYKSYKAAAFLGKRGCVLLALSDVPRQSAGPDFGLIDGKLSHGGFARELLKLLQKRKPESEPPPSLQTMPDILGGGPGFLLFGANKPFSFSLLGANQAGWY